MGDSCALDCTCGDYVCDPGLGETVANCMTDCACNANYMCEPWEDAKHCPRDCGDTAAYGNGEGHDAENGYDGTNQQFDGSNGHVYDSMNMDGYGLNSMSMMNGGNGEGNDDYGTCKDNDLECSDNSECCSSACVTYAEKGRSICRMNNLEDFIYVMLFNFDNVLDLH